MASKKKEPFKAIFQDEAADAEFKALMDRFGVRKTGKTEPKTKATASDSTHDVDPVEFNDQEGWTDPKRLSAALKKSKKGAPAKKPAAKRRVRLSTDFIPDVELDLHGFTRDEALRSVERVLESSRGKKCRHVLIITGRGLNSGENKGVLRKVIWNWLQQHQKILNIRCKWAPFFLGGKGAILVFFR